MVERVIYMSAKGEVYAKAAERFPHSPCVQARVDARSKKARKAQTSRSTSRSTSRGGDSIIDSDFEDSSHGASRGAEVLPESPVAGHSGLPPVITRKGKATTSTRPKKTSTPIGGHGGSEGSNQSLTDFISNPKKRPATTKVPDSPSSKRSKSLCYYQYFGYQILCVVITFYIYVIVGRLHGAGIASEEGTSPGVEESVSISKEDAYTPKRPLEYVDDGTGKFLKAGFCASRGVVHCSHLYLEGFFSPGLAGSVRMNAAGDIEPLTPEGPALNELDDQEAQGIAVGHSYSGSAVLTFFKDEIQQVLHQYPLLARDDPRVRGALEAFERRVMPAYEMHVDSQRKLRSKLPRPEDRVKLDQLKAHLASKEDELQAEVAVLDGINEQMAKLQEQSEAQQRIVDDRKRQVGESVLEVAAQRDLVGKFADPGLRSRLDRQDMNFKTGMVAGLENLIIEAVECPQ